MRLSGAQLFDFLSRALTPLFYLAPCSQPLLIDSQLPNSDAECLVRARVPPGFPVALYLGPRFSPKRSISKVVKATEISSVDLKVPGSILNGVGRFSLLSF